MYIWKHAKTNESQTVYQRLQLLKMKPQPSTTQASKISTKPQCASCAVACDPWLPREIARSIPLEVQVVWQVLRYSLAEPKQMSLRLDHKNTISHHPHNHLGTWQLSWFPRSKLPSWLILHSFDTRVPSQKKSRHDPQTLWMIHIPWPGNVPQIFKMLS